MEKYNYLEAVTADAKKWLLEHYSEDYIIEASEYYNIFYDEMIDEDSITGNASGSYTLNRWKAEENLCHNMDLLVDATEYYGYIDIPRKWVENPEITDVIIRCHLLNEAIYNAIEDIEIDKIEKENDIQN